MNRLSDPEALGRRIREARKRLGIKQSEMAERFQTQQSTISRWERGQLTPDYVSLIQLEILLGESLLTDAGYPVEEPIPVTRVPVIASTGPGCLSLAPDRAAPRLSVLADDRYPGVERYSVKIADHSMEDAYPVGSFVVFVPVGEIGRQLRQGDRIVMTDDRPESQRVLAREVRVGKAGDLWAVPCSADPSLDRFALSADNASATVVGLVVQSVRLE